MKITKSGTTAELMQLVEEKTTQFVAIYHEMDCRRGVIEHSYNVFVGNDNLKRCDNYEQVTHYLKSFLHSTDSN